MREQAELSTLAARRRESTGCACKAASGHPSFPQKPAWKYDWSGKSTFWVISLIKQPFRKM